MQQNKIYNEEALRRISSPDQLNGFIRTSGSGVWFVLAAIMLVLIGVIVWGFMGSFEVTLEVRGGTYNGNSVCFVFPAERDGIYPGLQVRYLSPDKTTQKGIISSISTAPISYEEACKKFSTGLVNRLGFIPGVELYQVDLLLNEPPRNEFATVKIIQQTVQPSHLLFNLSTGNGN